MSTHNAQEMQFLLRDKKHECSHLTVFAAQQQ